MNRFLSGILTLASIVATMTTATHIPVEEESRFSEYHSEFEETRSLRASKGKGSYSDEKTLSPTKRATKRLPLATRNPTNCKITPSPTRKATKRLPLATRKPTRTQKTPSPTKKATKRLPLATRKPTSPPTRELDCLAVDKAVYDCGDAITVSFDVSDRQNPEPARIQDFIGIFPYYVDSYDVPEVWQWTCSPPPFVPNTCSNGPNSSGKVVFHGLPKYNSEPNAWPVSANYNPLEREVNRFFKVVLLRGDGATYCVSSRFEILENSLPGCNIRVSSPSG